MLTCNLKVLLYNKVSCNSKVNNTGKYITTYKASCNKKILTKKQILKLRNYWITYLIKQYNIKL